MKPGVDRSRHGTLDSTWCTPATLRAGGSHGFQGGGWRGHTNSAAGGSRQSAQNFGEEPGLGPSRAQQYAQGEHNPVGYVSPAQEKNYKKQAEKRKRKDEAEEEQAKEQAQEQKAKEEAERKHAEERAQEQARKHLEEREAQYKKVAKAQKQQAGDKTKAKLEKRKREREQDSAQPEKHMRRMNSAGCLIQLRPQLPIKYPQ